jgi:hypothetical protein
LLLIRLLNDDCHKLLRIDGWICGCENLNPQVEWGIASKMEL